MKSLAHAGVAFLLVALMSPGHAANDVIHLKNGDRITGTIKRIWDEELTIEPDYSDEFSVDLALVERVESEREFDVRLPDGRDVVATLAGNDDAGNQILSFDEEEVILPLGALRELEEPEEFSDWEVLIDYSLSANTGNTESLNSRLYSQAMYKRGDHRHLLVGENNQEDVDSVTTKDQSVLAYTYNWSYSGPWFLGANVRIEQDPVRDLDYRFQGGVGIGRDFFDEPRRFLNAQLGVGLLDEKVGGLQETSTAANWLLRYRQDVLGEDLEVFHNHGITSTIDGRDNTIITTSTGIRYEISDLLYLNVSLDWDYESEPAANAEKTDQTFVIGAGLEFE